MKQWHALHVFYVLTSLYTVCQISVKGYPNETDFTN